MSSSTESENSIPWRSNPTRMIRVPVSLVDQVLLYARFLDANSMPLLDSELNAKDFSGQKVVTEDATPAAKSSSNVLSYDPELNNPENFFYECCFYQENEATPRTHAFKVYKKWCIDRKVYNMGESAFYKQIEYFFSKLGIFRTPQNRHSVYMNLGIKFDLDFVDWNNQ